MLTIPTPYPYKLDQALADAGFSLHQHLENNALSWVYDPNIETEIQAFINAYDPLPVIIGDLMPDLDAAFNSAITQDVQFATAGGVTKTYQADAASQDKLVKAEQGYSRAGAVPSGFYWVATDNTQVPFTLDDLAGLYSAMLARGWSAFQVYQQQKDTIRAATDWTTVAGLVTSAVAAIEAV